uniref:PD-(D/E)XK nuclease family protein n=1 Tax=Fervidobacterium thailandense TaxID=1008305 RepID=A0A7C4W2K1_9BACT
MVRRAYVVPIDGSHFDLVAYQAQQLYEKNPLDFLFIGPTGFYTRQIAERVAQNIGKSLNRNAFLVINQYITELLLRCNYDAEVLDRDFYTIYISRIIDELYENARRNEESYGSERLLLLKTLSKSNTIVQYIVEIFEKLWELELYGERRQTSEQYALVECLMNEESTFAQIIREVLAKMKEAAQQLRSKTVYDPVSIYNWYIENAKHVEQPRKYLVLSGFFDIPPLVQKALRELIKKSEEVFFFVWQKVLDSAFEPLEEIYRFLDENGFEFDYTLCNKKYATTKQLLETKKIIRVDTENTYFEYQYLVKEVKRLLIEGTEPEDIGVVVPNSIIAQRVMEEFDEAKIPFRYSGQISLIDSQIVKILLQPLVTIENNYRSEDLLALIESPLVPERSLSMDEIEQFFKEYNYFSVSLTPSEMRDKDKRYQAYFEKLDADIEFLRTKLTEVTAEELDEDEEIDVLSLRSERLEKLENFKLVMESVFRILDEIHEKRKEGADFFEWYRGFIKSAISKFSHAFDAVNSLKTTATFRSFWNEMNAFVKFIEVLNKLEMYVRKLKESEIVKELKSWDKIFKIFQVLLSTSGYRETFKSANVVDIVDLSTARFVYKKYKFFVEFTDDYYPSISKINPLIFRTGNERSKIYDTLESTERRSTLLAIIFSKQAKLIFPRATSTGEEIVASKYITEFANSLEEAVFTENDIFKELDYEIRKLRTSVEQNVSLKPSDFIVGSTNIYEFSHSKISEYLSCPLKFYYSSVVGISRPAKFSDLSRINRGLVVHRVLKKMFDGRVLFEVLEDDVRRFTQEAYDSVYSQGIWKYSIPREMTVKEIVKELVPLLNLIYKDKIILRLGYKSLSPANVESTESGVLSSERVIALEKEFRKVIGNYTILARVDRIDRLQNNYSALDEKTPVDRPAYAIIDYKSSENSIKNAFVEQLLLYDYVISHQNQISEVSQENVADYYLIFLATKPSNGRYAYEYVKSEIGELKSYVFKVKRKREKAGKNAERKFVPIAEFENWLIKVLENISQKGDFVPIFLDYRSRSFISEISADLQDGYEIDVPAGSKRTQKCRKYMGRCSYEPLCSMFETYGIKLP